MRHRHYGARHNHLLLLIILLLLVHLTGQIIRMRRHHQEHIQPAGTTQQVQPAIPATQQKQPNP